MDTLEILKAKINLQTTIIKFTSSIEELQAKHPERKDLIDSMVDSLEDISQFQSVFVQFEDQYLLECKSNLRLQMVISEQKHELVINKGWDLMIAHPPCTYLALSGNRWLYNKDGSKNEERYKNQKEALDFVSSLMSAPIKRIAIENPLSVISSKIRKPEQIVQPWMFGDKAQKSTCLWLKNLPLLKPTDIVDKGEFIEFISKDGKKKKQPLWVLPSFAKSKNTRRKKNIKK